jgi:uncharacterized protein (DUF1697 family)
VAGYAAFLRAINVGGRRITGPDLCVPFTEMGFEDVASFRASGNVVFSAGRKPSEARIEEGLETALGYDVGVFLRTRAEMLALAAAEPFGASDLKFHVMFLKQLPANGARDEVLAHGTDDDRLAFGERELFWEPRGRMVESELDLKAIGKLIGTNTMRTKGTVEQIAAKYFGG